MIEHEAVMAKLDELLVIVKQIHGGYPTVFDGEMLDDRNDLYAGDIHLIPLSDEDNKGRGDFPLPIPLEEID